MDLELLMKLWLALGVVTALAVLYVLSQSMDIRGIMVLGYAVYTIMAVLAGVVVSSVWIVTELIGVR